MDVKQGILYQDMEQAKSYLEKEYDGDFIRDAFNAQLEEVPEEFQEVCEEMLTESGGNPVKVDRKNEERRKLLAWARNKRKRARKRVRNERRKKRKK